MKKIEFINDSAPYLSAENLNLLQDNVEEAIEQAKTKTTSIWSGHLYNIGTEHTQLFSEPLETGKLYMFVLLGLSSSYRMTIPYIHGTGNGIQHSYYDGTTVVRWRINISTDGTGFYLDAASLQMGVSSGVLAVYKVD